jgi:hypothetical protein
MSEVSINPTGVVAADHLSHPSMTDLARFADELVASFDSEVAKTLAWAEGGKEYGQRSHIIVTPEGETIDDPVFRNYCHEIGDAALSLPPEDTDDLAHMPKIVTLPLGSLARKVTGSYTWLASFSLRIGTLSGLGEAAKRNKWAATERVTASIQRVTEDNLGEGPGYPALDISSVREIIKPVIALNKLMEADARNEADAHAITQLLKSAPSRATLEYLVLRAYGSTINFLGKDSAQAKTPVGVLAAEMRHKLVDQHGFTPKDVIAYEAALILGLPHCVQNEDGGMDDIPRKTILSKAFGFNKGFKRLLGISISDDLSTSRFVPEYAKPALAAQETIEELLKIYNTDADHYLLAADNNTVRSDITNASIMDTRAFLESSYKAFYEEFNSSLADNINDITAVTAALHLEKDMIARLRSTIERLRDSRAINDAMLIGMEELLQPKLSQYIDADI